MNTTRPCGCKGHRSCLECEKTYKISPQNDDILNSNLKKFVYCPYCNLCYENSDPESYKNHPNHQTDLFKFDGIYIQLNFLTDREHDELIKGIDSMPWDASQSGRRKQNFGPKCNFKQRKLRLGDFNGFPEFTKVVQEKFKTLAILENFQTIEQCSLEYDPFRGASIEPHVDDCWIWGERIVTVNLLSDSVLTLTPNRHPNRYNLDLVPTYPKVIQSDGVDEIRNGIILVPMPNKSLIVMYGRARYDYEHRILRDDIQKRRVCLAYREFTPMYLSGGESEEEGKIVTKKALQFFQCKFSQ
ncbi:hypothetical protein ABEB36_000451 [Hypothenemus hampei]|uniref:Uncharacterized protein n=1 Tax=Hypothenemus hampei TaxID=57062 RepID=A0ABD1FBZ0_HYPHA